MAKNKGKCAFGQNSDTNGENYRQNESVDFGKIVEGITHLDVIREEIDKSFAKMEVSLFKQVTVKEGEVNHPMNILIGDLLSLIKTDKTVKENTEKYRAKLPECGKKGRECQSIKFFQMPAFGVACHMEGGTKKDNCRDFTGLVMIDLDDYAPGKAAVISEQLKTDPYVVMSYRTPSGGLRALVYVEGIKDEPTYQYAWSKAGDYFFEKTGIANDVQTKNINRLSVVSHDPDAYFNEGAQVFPVDFSQMLQPAPKRKVGRPATKKLAKAWELVEKRLEREGVEYAEGKRNAYITRVAYLMNEYGLPLDMVTDWAVNRFSDYGDGEQGVRSVFASCYKDANDQFGTREVKDGGGAQLLLDIQDSIRKQALVRYNIIKNKQFIRWNDDDTEQPMTDRDFIKLWHNGTVQMDSTRDLTKLFKQELNNPEFVPSYNPLEEYVLSLPEWKEGDTDYLGQAAGMVKVNEKHCLLPFKYVFTKWYANFTDCMVNPGTKNEGILAFIGRQNCGKTTFCENLLPKELHDYVTTQGNISFQTRDERSLLCENALIILDEMDHMNSRMFELVKSTTSTAYITDRLAYAERNEQRPRVASFCATGNEMHVLPEANNRRWLIYEVESISKERFNMNHAGMLAQAYALLKSGFDYRFTEEEVELIERQNERFQAPDLVEEAIRDCFDIPEDTDTVQCDIFSTHEILKIINSSHQLQKCSPKKLGNTLKRMGRERISVTGGKKGYKLRLRPPKSYNIAI